MVPGTMRRRHTLTAVAAGLVGALVPAGVAFADPAGPTDYASHITSIEPQVPGFRAQIIGGDSFLRLVVEPGTDVVVEGYAQEPYLHFDTAGVVQENQRSPATYLNATRFGATAPAGADPTLPPDWRAVATDGTYAWHDHRAHWMSQQGPVGFSRGDQIQTATIPIVVNGTPVAIAVATTWLPEPSRLPLAIGAAVGGALVLLALFARRRLGLALLAVAVAAAGIGWWQYQSLPTETGPLLVWWLLPVVAAASVVLALVLGRRLVSYALVLLAAMELAVWVWLRRDGAFRALIPTDAPYWLDRGVMAATAVVAVVAAIGAAVALFRLPVGDG
jgi:hypothetical protein